MRQQDENSENWAMRWATGRCEAGDGRSEKSSQAPNCPDVQLIFLGISVRGGKGVIQGPRRLGPHGVLSGFFSEMV